LARAEKTLENRSRIKEEEEMKKKTNYNSTLGVVGLYRVLGIVVALEEVKEDGGGEDDNISSDFLD